MQPGQLSAHRGGDLQGVGGGRRIDTEIGGIFTVQLRAGAIAARAQLNGRHVRQAHQLAAFAAANHNLPEAGGVAESPDTVDGQRLLLAVKYRRRPHLPRRALHVLLAQRLGNIVGCDIQRVHAVGPQPDAHAVVARAEHLYFPDAG